MEVSGKILLSDYIRARHLALRPSRSVAVIGLLILAFLVAAFLVLLPSVWIALLCILTLASFALIAPFTSWQQYRNYPLLALPFSIRLQDDGLVFHSERSQGLLKWEDIIRCKSNRKLLLIYLAPNLYYLVPSHFFDSEKDFHEFRQHVESGVWSAGDSPRKE